VIRRYSDLVGKPVLPPKWAFGLGVSSGFEADSAEATVARARELREHSHSIPASVLHLNCFWQKFGWWSDLDWDADAFLNLARTSVGLLIEQTFSYHDPPPVSWRRARCSGFGPHVA
jgi:alpha-glucosidase (family GH31 glycosyl hydrolase)